MSFAEVAVHTDVPYRQGFTYAIPQGMEVAPGSGVLVPFGRHTLAGVVLDVGERPAYDGETRFLLAAAGVLLTADQIALAHWLSRRYRAPLYTCVSLMLPPMFDKRLRVMVSAVEESVADLSESGARMLATIAEAGEIDVVRLRRSFRGETAAVLAELRQAGRVHERLTFQTPALPAESPTPARVQPPHLLPDQRAAVDAIRAAALATRHAGDRPPVFLLHGVTGSGKTEVYLAALDAVAASGGRGIVIVPEIALTPQAVQRFEARFPGRVAALHSDITGRARERLWHAIRAGRYAVVVGTRSALFAPQPDLGLIVIDEEHEWTLKQVDPEPRYHARDVAIRLAQAHGATVVLGSATPDVGSFAHAQAGHYTLLSMPSRVHASLRSEQGGGVPRDGLPRIEIVDLADELRRGNRGIFSRSLDDALTQTLARGEQAILFLNRRGGASFVLCRDCGYVPACSGCAVPFTVHTADTSLRCHQCNRRRGMLRACPACRGTRVRLFGLGTQRVEAEVRERFPTARVLRWDRDTAKHAADHDRILCALKTGAVDVVVGTQMLAKGHDVPNVTLVGVVSADIALNMPDFRAGERAYQLLTQVAGRAGRGDKPGRVIIQTYTPDHYAIRATAAHDYRAMVREELRVRRQVGYPPFTRLARLVYAHTNAAYAESEANRFATELRQQRETLGLPGVEVVGPAPAFHARVRGRWRWQILVRAHDPAELLDAVSLRRGWVVDIDPVSLI